MKIQIKKLKDLKRYNEIFKGLKDISSYELNKNGVKFYIDKIENLLY